MRRLFVSMTQNYTRKHKQLHLHSSNNAFHTELRQSGERYHPYHQNQKEQPQSQKNLKPLYHQYLRLFAAKMSLHIQTHARGHFGMRHRNCVSRQQQANFRLEKEKRLSQIDRPPPHLRCHCPSEPNLHPRIRTPSCGQYSWPPLPLRRT